MLDYTGSKPRHTKPLAEIKVLASLIHSRFFCSAQIVVFCLFATKLVFLRDQMNLNSLHRFLKTAEMLKPPTPGHDSNIVEEYFPNVGKLSCGSCEAFSSMLM